MNWRVLVGLLFLVCGMVKMYQLIAEHAAHNLSGNPIYAEVGCSIWMMVGIYLVINGIKNGKGH